MAIGNFTYFTKLIVSFPEIVIVGNTVCTLNLSSEKCSANLSQKCTIFDLAPNRFLLHCFRLQTLNKIQTRNKMETVYANGMMNGSNLGQAEMAAAQSVLNWNPNQLDIKTKSVEKTLEPLVMQVGIHMIIFP